MIPRVFHGIWTQGDPPTEYWAWIDSWEWHNPDWTYQLWHEDTYQELLGDLRRVHDSTPYEGTGAHLAQKADIAGKAILLELGGVAMCLDFEALKPMGHLFDTDQVVCWWESPGQLSSGMIGAPPGHPAVAALVDALPESVFQQRERGQQINNGAGPKFVHRVWENRPDVQKRHHGEIYPYYWYEDVPETFGDSLAVHHWQASWKPREDGS